MSGRGAAARGIDGAARGGDRGRGCGSDVGGSCDRTWDVAVVGSGAAGLAAAVGAAAAGLSVVVLGRSEPGGGVRGWARLETVPGLPVGLSGREYTDRTLARAEAYGARLASPSAVEALEEEGEGWVLRREDGGRVRARAVVVATGAERARPPVPGIDAFLGAGVYPSLTRALAARLPGRDVFVEGEAGPAGALAARLAGVARSVTLLGPAARAGCGKRGPAGGPGALPNVVLRPGLELAGLHGVDHVEAVVLRSARTGRREAREAGAVFLVSEARPRTGWLAGACATGASGGLLVGAEAGAAGSARPPLALETSLPGVFAAGAARERAGDGWEPVADGMAAAAQVAARGIARAACSVHRCEA